MNNHLKTKEHVEYWIPDDSCWSCICRQEIFLDLFAWRPESSLLFLQTGVICPLQNDVPYIWDGLKTRLKLNFCLNKKPQSLVFGNRALLDIDSLWECSSTSNYCTWDVILKLPWWMHDNRLLWWTDLFFIRKNNNLAFLVNTSMFTRLVLLQPIVGVTHCAYAGASSMLRVLGVRPVILCSRTIQTKCRVNSVCVVLRA